METSQNPDQDSDCLKPSAGTQPPPLQPPQSKAAEPGLPPASSEETISNEERDDHDESDWDELDEVLDDFSATSTKLTNAGTTASSKEPVPQAEPLPEPSCQAAESPPPSADFDEDAVLKQLEAGMAELMQGAAGPSASGSDKRGESNDEGWGALAQELSNSGMAPADLMKLLMGDDLAETIASSTDGTVDGRPAATKPLSPAVTTSTVTTTTTTTTASIVNEEVSVATTSQTKGQDKTKSSEDTFQETIRKTMQRMQDSGAKASAEAAAGGGDDMSEALLVQMLKAMEAAGAGAGDGGLDGTNDENLDKMFMGIMEQLSNKEMLYEPIKELHVKFGPWLTNNRDKLPVGDRQRFETQAAIVADIVAKFEEDGYTDDNPECRAYIWDKMQKMQAAGSPPDDLIAHPFGDDPGMKDLLGDAGGCPQQ